MWPCGGERWDRNLCCRWPFGLMVYRITSTITIQQKCPTFRFWDQERNQKPKIRFVWFGRDRSYTGDESFRQSPWTSNQLWWRAESVMFSLPRRRRHRYTVSFDRKLRELWVGTWMMATSPKYGKWITESCYAQFSISSVLSLLVLSGFGRTCSVRI